jgi:hypothetical protein
MRTALSVFLLYAETGRVSVSRKKQLYDCFNYKVIKLLFSWNVIFMQKIN